MGELVGEYATRERASGAPSGVADSLLPSENHEAIPCIERVLRDVGSGLVVGGIGGQGGGQAAGGVEGTAGRANTREFMRPLEREREIDR